MHVIDKEVLMEMKRCIENSGLFDFDYYRNMYFDIVKNEMDLILHYIQYGAAMGFDPSPWFDTNYYLQAVEGLREDGMNPLVHYIMYGINECRHTLPEDSTNDILHDIYSQWRQEHRALKISPVRLRYYVNTILKSGEFDSEYYESLSEISRNTKEKQVLHYLTEGMYRELGPNRMFDIRYYVNSYHEQISDKIPFIHFIKEGRKHGYQCYDFQKAEHTDKCFKRLRYLYNKVQLENKKNRKNAGVFLPVSSLAANSAVQRIDSYLQYTLKLTVNLIINWEDKKKIETLAKQIWDKHYPYRIKLFLTEKHLDDFDVSYDGIDIICKDDRNALVEIPPEDFVWRVGQYETSSILHMLDHCILCASEDVMAVCLLYDGYAHWDTVPGYYVKSILTGKNEKNLKFCMVRRSIMEGDIGLLDNLANKIDGGRLILVYDPSVEKDSEPQKIETVLGCKKHILISIYKFSYGGGEIMPIRLANQLKKIGYPVLVHALDQEENQKVRKMLNPSIPVVRTDDINELTYILNWYHIDVVSTHHQMNQSLFADVLKNNPVLHAQVRHVATSHGMYNAFSKADLKEIFQRLKGGIDFWTYVADKNLEPFLEMGIYDEHQFRKIPNGIEAPVLHPVDKRDLDISQAAFVFCLASRAIKEKGWEEAIEAIDIARKSTGKDIQLILIGDGPVYKELISEPCKEFVHLLGFKDNPCDYYAISDAMILLSYYSSESAPLSIIEALQCGIPVIASDIGDIRQMLTCGEEVAGGVFELDNWKVPISKVAEIIGDLVLNVNYYEICCKVARKKAKEFDIEEITKQYLDTFQASL